MILNLPAGRQVLNLTKYMDFQKLLQITGEFGVITEVDHPIVYVEGLPGARMHELVFFENGELGEVFSLNKHSVEVLVFSKNAQKAGTKVTRTNEHLSVPVGESLLSTIIDPLGNPLSTLQKVTMPTEKRETDIHPLGMNERAKIKTPFHTGVTLVDMMVPLGRGQKELIIGDRKTGKSSFLLATIKTQVQLGSIAIYVTVAKKKSDIKKIQEFFVKEGLSKSTIIVATTSYDSPSLIYRAPYAGMTIAEYFRDLGKDVVIVLDDLSTHAKFYREISLLARRFPGRDSYPGDIFYTHARLLERAGNFKHKSGKEVSITVLPIAEIIEGDFTGYIATNLMGMTDGHIYFDSNVYYRGQRPAVNILLSVTRVGRQSQSDLLRSINRELTSFFALYENMQNLSHFGAELTDTVKNILSTGEAIYTLFDQPYQLIVPLDVQIVLFGLLWLKVFEDSELGKINIYRENLLHAYTEPDVQKLFHEVVTASDLNRLLGNISARRDQLVQLCKIEPKQ